VYPNPQGKGQSKSPAVSGKTTMSSRASDLATAFSLLSRLPVPRDWINTERNAQAAWAYPVVGLAHGVIAAAAMLLATALGLPSALAVLVALTALVLLSGAMHEDGLADLADGVWGGWTPETRLEIMRDSRIGTFGVVALALSLATRAIALWILVDISVPYACVALIAVAALSRAGMPFLMALLPQARKDGLSRSIGEVPLGAAWIGLALAGGPAVLLLGWSTLALVFWGGLAALGVGSLARRKLGGQTGDVLGGAQQITEITLLLTLVA